MLYRAAIVSLLSLFSISLRAQTGHGKFDGLPIQANLVEDSRDIILREPVTYTDWDGRTLTAPKGFRSDGASIPQAAWSLVGGPLDGPYRQAAVIHDAGCVTHQYPWKDTARIFYEAMIDSNVSKIKALTFYYAVYVAGPHWKALRVASSSSRDEVIAKAEAAAKTIKPSELARKDTDGNITWSYTRAEVSNEVKLQSVPHSPGVLARKASYRYEATVLGISATKSINESDLKNIESKIADLQRSKGDVNLDDVEALAASNRANK